MLPPAPLSRLVQDLAEGRTTSRALTEACLDAITDPAGEGALAFPHGVSVAALAEADRQDALRRSGRPPSPYAGIPISLKDNIDQAGQVTRAGSRLLASEPAALVDAPVAARLRVAGLVVIGRTGMTELAFSGLGLNPHYGTPANPRSTEVRRIPGGSSAGAAISVATGMAAAAVGTDTGGSCRIPAAFCGLVGWKPTAGRVPRAGVFPLSSTLDCVGVLGRTADCCAALDGLMSGQGWRRDHAIVPGRARVAALQGYVLDSLDEVVATAYGAALDRLRVAGVEIEEVEVPALSQVAELNAQGGLSSLELSRHLGPRLRGREHEVDPRVARRIALAAGRPASEHSRIVAARAELMAKVAPALDRFDAVLCPTTSIVAPRFDELEQDLDYDRLNLKVLRNPSIANMLDRCAITLPCDEPGQLPVGLTLMGRSGGDQDLLSLACALEPLIRGDAGARSS